MLNTELQYWTDEVDQRNQPQQIENDERIIGHMGFGGFGRPDFGFGSPFFGGFTGGLLDASLLSPGYGY